MTTKKQTWTPPMLSNGQPDFEHWSSDDWEEYERRFQSFLAQLQKTGVKVGILEVGHNDRTHDLN
jgi:hypothetical protein